MIRFVTLFLMAVVSTGLGFVSPAAAQENNNPTVTFMLASEEELEKDLGYLVSELAENPKAWEEHLQPILETFEPGVELTKPMRIDVILGGPQERYRPSFPISNLNNFFRRNLNLFGIQEKKIAGPGPGQLYRLTGDFEGFLLYKDGYATIAERREDLPADLPNPMEALAPLMKKGYDAALNITNRPEGLEERRSSFQEFRAELEAGLTKQEDETEEEFSARKTRFENQLDELERFFVESAQMMMGWTTDSSKGEGRGNLSLTALPGTALAESIQLLGQEPGYFANLQRSPNSILFGRINHPLGPMRQQNFLDIFAAWRPVASNEIATSEKLTEEEKQATQKATDLYFQMLEEGTKAGHLNGFIEVTQNETGPYTLVSGIRAANGKNAEEIVRLFPQIGSEFQVDENIEQVEGVNIHSISVNRIDRPDLQELFGQETVVYVGAGENTVWIAAGQEPLPRLRGAIEKAAASAPSDAASLVGEIFVEVGPWIKMRDKRRGEEGDPELRRLAIEAFEAGEDTFYMRLNRVDNGVEGYGEFNTGILRFIGEVMADFALETL